MFSLIFFYKDKKEQKENYSKNTFSKFTTYFVPKENILK